MTAGAVAGAAVAEGVESAGKAWTGPYVIERVAAEAASARVAGLALSE